MAGLRTPLPPRLSTWVYIQVSGKGMPQRVAAGGFENAYLEPGHLHGPLQNGFVKVVTAPFSVVSETGCKKCAA